MRRLHIAATVAIAAFAAQSAVGQDDVRIDDGSTFPFYIESLREHYGELHHSGHRSWLEQGVDRQDWNAPDCLILGGSFEPLKMAETEKFLSGLDVRDDLFTQGGGVELRWTLHNGNYAYFLKGLSRYIDGISVKTKDSNTTFYQLMVEAYGMRQDNLRLTLSRGCRLSRP